MLLERGGVNPYTPDTRFGQTPLCWASVNRHGGIVKMLLQRDDVNPGKADRWGQTPLLSAAWNGYVGVVRVFNSLNPDRAFTWSPRISFPNIQ